MNTLIDIKIGKKKKELLDYYRSRAQEIISEARQVYADTEYKKRASAVNKSIVEVRGRLIKSLEQIAKKKNWGTKELLEGVLMITYTNYIAMLEARNEVWPYEYMTFSRRIGELWEPLCQLCWEYPLNSKIQFFTPPLFKDVKKKLVKEIENFIEGLNISTGEKKELKKYYRKVWKLVTSGEIKLELDLHFNDGKHLYVVDFKSGFSSNEKGNTNRLLLVASVYQILEEEYKCLLLVRSEEDQNNHYLQILKRSGLWQVYTGQNTCKQIQKYTGFNISKWITKNIKWENDFSEDMYKYLSENSLLQYLKW